MTRRMQISSAGLELIKTFEGLRETAVRLPDGRWTIGHGHVRTAREGLKITAQDAETLLTHDLKPIEAAISAMVYAPLMQGQFDALVSLAYNISLGQFRDSEIVGHLNSGNHLAAANGFDLWRRARLHGRVMVVDALVRRRAAEKALFLEHPSGPPSAPTPLVPPELDTDEVVMTRSARTPAAPEVDEPETEAPSGVAINEIADAVRRLAERMQGAVSPAMEIPLPPGAAVVPDDDAEQEPAFQPQLQAEVAFEAGFVADAEVGDSVIEPNAPHGEPEQQARPVSAQQLDRDSRVIAERVSRILSGVQNRIEAQEAVGEPVAPKAAAAGTASTTPPKAAEVREGLPNFDLPSESLEAEEAEHARKLIDDTEILEPGRDPSQLFAEAEQQAKVVNGHARRVGPLSGRAMVLAPWIIVLALSVLGFLIGAVDTFKGNGLEAGIPRLAATILAVFGVMMVMSLYFIFWKRSSDEG